ncbi:hypothetical protein ACFRSX_18485 [Streptomyces goshikiensis]|uniref:hypothetical protein n=1 Tax=Streptomyces TaxID=1883 RepID=UPI000C270905|nr:hypothetical protein [Streptomyces sp. CB02120-2]PJN20882.1 hypothetical protein CG724_03780 [Streptomyces sp. CB02120-2]
MTTPNTPPAPDAAAQGSHQWILTLELPGRAAATQYGTWNPYPGSTRHDVSVAIRQHVTNRFPDLERATVALFALEPNQL